MQKVELAFKELITKKRKGVLRRVIYGALLLLSIPYRLVIAFRNWGYDCGIFSSYISPVPVVSIGNVVAGGAGKTPFTELLLKRLTGDLQVALLSRGYRSKAERLPAPLILSKGRGPEHSALMAGDEPYLLAKNIPDAWVIVGRDRVQSSRVAVKKGAECIVLDDGMQHRALSRDVEIVVIDGNSPFGMGHLLPAGFLREPLKALSRADLIVLNHATDLNIGEIEDKIRRYTKAPVITTAYLPVEIGMKEERCDLEVLRGKRVGAFCGIAHPSYFFNGLKNLGVELVDQLDLGDHRSINESGLTQFIERCRAQGAEIILCTEKDYVKLPEDFRAEMPLYFVKAKLEVIRGEEVLQQVIDRVKQEVQQGDLSDFT